MMKRILCVILALVLCVGMVPTTAFAAEGGNDELSGRSVEAEGSAQIPDTPETSDTSKAPDAPKAPETPDKTDTPDTQVDPDNTDKANILDNPETPDNTDKADTPDDPDGLDASEDQPDNKEYACVSEFEAAIAKMGDATDEASTRAVIAECLAIYARLSPEDQAAQAEAYAYIQSYARDLGQSDIDLMYSIDGDYVVTFRGKVNGSYQTLALAYVPCGVKSVSIWYEWSSSQNAWVMKYSADSGVRVQLYYQTVTNSDMGGVSWRYTSPRTGNGSTTQTSYSGGTPVSNISTLKVQIEYIDQDTGKVVGTGEYQPSAYGTHTVKGTAPSGYTIVGDTSKSVTTTKDGSTPNPLQFIVKLQTADYTITWVDTDGSTLKPAKNRKGTVGNVVSATDTDKVLNGYVYRAGKSKDSATLESSGTVLKLVFAKKITVTWVDENGKPVLDGPKDAYQDEIPAYSGTEPTKDADADNTYTFSGWYTYVDPTSGNITYTATYTATPKKVTATWMDGYTDTPIKREEVAKDISNDDLRGLYPDSPTREGFAFTGWEEARDNNGNITITAQWKEDKNGNVTPDDEEKYTVSYLWTNSPDGCVLPEAKEYLVGAEVTVDTTFQKGTEVKVGNRVYTFSGWDWNDFSMPPGNVVIIGSWTVTDMEQKYKVVYAWGGDVPNGVTLPEGGQYAQGTPVSVDTAYYEGYSVDEGEFHYTFSGWDWENFEMPDANVFIWGSWTKETDNGGGISVQKERTSPATVKVGDTITWKITVRNLSNVEKTVKLTEKLEGAVLNKDTVTLASGTSETVTATYVVKDSDAGNTILNSVIASTGKDGEDKEATDTEGGIKIPDEDDPVEIKVKDLKVTYDGKGHEIQVEANVDYTVSYTKDGKPCGTPTDAGEYTATITYKDGTVTGKVTIEKTILTVTTASAKKYYDGKALTKDAYEVKGLVNGETVNITVTGSQTKVGSSDNTFTIAWADGTTKVTGRLRTDSPTAKSTNYTLVSKLGTLTVKKVPSGGWWNPKTGDIIMRWVVVLILSGGALAAILIVYKKKKKQK